MVDLLQNVIWRARCDDQIQAELLQGIDKRSKRRRSSRSNPDPTSLYENDAQVNPNLQTSPRLSTNNEWFIWVNDVCH